jgi:hypothetical protein
MSQNIEWMPDSDFCKEGKFQKEVENGKATVFQLIDAAPLPAEERSRMKELCSGG